MEDHIKAALDHVIKLLKNKNHINGDILNSNQPSTAFVQVSNTINCKKYNGITKLKQPTPPNKIIQSAPPTKDKITSEGASARNKRPAKSKVKPMSDEEFDLLLKNLHKPIPTSKGEKHKKVATTPMTKLF